jgi:hypothetical protein
LKNWGREHGLSILPVFFKVDRLTSISQEDFERLLCQELYSYDPFDITGPVSDDAQFYGRRTEAQDLARQLQQGQIKSCLGIRKIGKTSILNRVVSMTKSHHRCHCIMVDCSTDEIWSMTAGQLIYSMGNALVGSIALEGSYSRIYAITEDVSIADGSKKLLESITQANLPVVIFFDEVDYITPSSPTELRWKKDFNEFWRNLRSAYQEASRLNKEFSILISGVSSKWFRVASIDGIENAALSFIPEEYLSPLPRGASNAMIKSLSRVAGLQFDELITSLIGEVCSDIPFWMRKACSYIHRQIEIQIRPYQPEKELVSTLLERFIESEGGALAEVALTHLFRVYPELEEIAIKCHHGSSSTCQKQYLNILERYGVISRTNHQYQISGRMMTEGLILYLEEKHTSSTSVVDSKELKQSIKFDNLNEWADELAIVSRERNLLEKNLRSVILNFIRSDALQNKDSGTTKTRLLSIVDISKGTFDPLSPEEAIEKFYWIDLKKLVEKEWTVFKNLFGDKKQFSEHCDVVNQRPDAHAKDIDRVGIARYRDSLNWLKDRISR